MVAAACSLDGGDDLADDGGEDRAEAVLVPGRRRDVQGVGAAVEDVSDQ